MEEALKNERSLDAFSFPEDVILNDEQGVGPIVSTFTAGSLVNIYRVVDGIREPQYIYSAHGDGGVLSDFGGPFASLEDAKEHFDYVDEGWTDY